MLLTPPALDDRRRRVLLWMRAYYCKQRAGSGRSPRRWPMTQAQVVREFAADPASVALLLAGPAADAFWPHDDGGDLAVAVGPPMRSGVGFVVDLTVSEPAAGNVRGRLPLVPCRGQTSVGRTSARLVLTGV